MHVIEREVYLTSAYCPANRFVAINVANLSLRI